MREFVRTAVTLTPAWGMEVLEQFGRTLAIFLFSLLVVFDPHLDFFKVVDLEISCLGSRSKNPELEYVSSYGPDTFRVKPQYSGETSVFG